MAPASSNPMFSLLQTLVSVSALVASIGLALPLASQTGPTVEIGTGLFNGFRGGNRDEKFGYSIAVQATARARNAGALSLLLGFNAAAFLKVSDGNHAVCVNPDPGTPVASPCYGDYPDARIFNVQAGMEHRVGTGIAFRFLAGPGLYKAWETHTKWGVQGRADVAFHSRSHVAFVLWTQGGVMPIENSPVGIPLLFGLGIRAQ